MVGRITVKDSIVNPNDCRRGVLHVEIIFDTLRYSTRMD